MEENSVKKTFHGENSKKTFHGENSSKKNIPWKRIQVKKKTFHGREFK